MSSFLLYQRQALEHIQRKARAGYTYLDDITGNVSPHLEEIDVHRCPRLSDYSLAMLLEPALTPQATNLPLFSSTSAFPFIFSCFCSSSALALTAALPWCHPILPMWLALRVCGSITASMG